MKKGNSKSNPVRHKPPSRIKYEQSHPVVSFRVSQDTYEQLRERSRISGKSMASIILAYLTAETSARKIAYKQGYDEGYRQGYHEAKSRFGITYPCAICGGAIELASDNEKAAVAEYMVKHGWCHAECHKKA